MISVAMATYCGEKYILQQLNSILHQTCPVDEVVISDDASKDQTAQIVAQFIKENHLEGTWHLIVNEHNLGFNGNFFSALDHTHGEIVFLSDQDDVWLSNKVKVMTEYMECHQECMALSSAYTLIDGNGDPFSEENKVLNAITDQSGNIEPVSVDSQIVCSRIRGCAMCLRRPVIQKADREHLSPILGHDWALNMMAALLGKNQILHQPLFQYRFHGDNNSLSAVSRKTLIDDTEKRKTALQRSIEAHEWILKTKDQYPCLTDGDAEEIRKAIVFEKKRLIFLSKKHFSSWLSLIGSLKEYERYYHTTKGAWKVYFGDLCYAYQINFKIR
ncbi:MAG: glycosyltransferase [Clostridiales bacterium]|jgi:glycosyltransferase involved in cell wall biosynthesis|nr:glycosyltransferase [Clostridiales bacterium]MCI2021774.1 glycosyltransferase [Clostridiales bacterium]MCI2026561.1 glycosyltransferase [Clostridiales bacterium]MCI2161332.1 glycosyltransferase [Oscillospiraceae bacterium]MCI2190999.1 glycosyltransferase [Oscillospiraceae bacterium]